jgi:hypothetical protein
MAPATCLGLDNCGTWLVGSFTTWAEIFFAIAGLPLTDQSVFGMLWSD